MPVSPHCPRCAYDLSGTVASWKGACPLTGRCPECGVDFAWVLVFNPARADVPGFVEHARTKGEFVTSALRTWRWTLLPWVFWRKVRLEGRMRPLRAWAWLLFVLLCAHAIASTLACVNAFIWSTRFRRVPDAIAPVVWDYLSDWTYPILTLPTVRGRFRGIKDIEVNVSDVPWLTFALVLHCAFAVMLLALPFTLDRAQVRMAHVQRAFVYGLSPLVVLALLRALGEALSIVEYATGANVHIPPLEDLDFAYVPAFALPFAGWIALWWLVCFVRGWRLRHGVFVWLLLEVAAWLLTSVILGEALPWNPLRARDMNGATASWTIASPLSQLPPHVRRVLPSGRGRQKRSVRSTAQSRSMSPR